MQQISCSAIVRTHCTATSKIVQNMRVPATVTVTNAHCNAENDDSLTEDDKAIARFQQQRLKQARNSTASPILSKELCPLLV